jgi:ADP-ribose pyrophosphatase
MKKADLTEHTISSETVYQGRMLHFKSDRIRLPDGKEGIREYIVHPGAVAVVPLLNKDEIVLERQHRYPLHQDFLEIPAGKLEVGEDPLRCAQRELLEETGYVAKSWKEMTTIHPCIGYSNERIIIFIAKDLHLEKAKLDEGEFLEVMTVRISEALEWIQSGKITDPKTIISLFWLKQFNGFI